MNLAFMFNYPLVDNVDWKKQVIKECISLGYDVDVYYSKVSFVEYVKAFLLKRKFGGAKSVSNRLRKKSQKNVAYIKQLGIPLFKVKNYNSNEVIRNIKSSKYDYVITALDQILSKSFVEGIDSRILNIHYARLPGIKGMNAIEWNYLVNRNCELTLHYINAGIDTGSIIEQKRIDFDPKDDFLRMREKLQSRIPETLIDFLQNPSGQVIENKGGNLYTFMHHELQGIIKT